MAEFVILSCPSCGGKLEITHDMDGLPAPIVVENRLLKGAAALFRFHQ